MCGSVVFVAVVVVVVVVVVIVVVVVVIDIERKGGAGGSCWQIGLCWFEADAAQFGANRCSVHISPDLLLCKLFYFLL